MNENKKNVGAQGMLVPFADTFCREGWDASGMGCEWAVLKKLEKILCFFGIAEVRSSELTSFFVLKCMYQSGEKVFYVTLG